MPTLMPKPIDENTESKKLRPRPVSSTTSGVVVVYNAWNTVSTLGWGETNLVFRADPVQMMKLPVEERSRMLAMAATKAEEEYRTNASLTDFNAFGDGDLYDETP